MTEQRFTLAQVFDVSKIDKTKLNEITKKKISPEVDAADPDAEPAAPPIPGFLQDQMVGMMVSKLGEILGEVDVVGDILGSAWGKAPEILEYLSPDCPPDETYLVPLIEHEITSEHSPAVEPKFKQQSLGEFIFDIALSLMVEGAILEIRAGRIRKIHIGSCTGTGGMGHQGIQLLEFPEQVIEAIKGAITLAGEGLKIGGKTDEPPETPGSPASPKEQE
ncbi:MAG: hypothetical protein ACOYME_00680 [Prochlorotrichaceae cyanobacterium]